MPRLRWKPSEDERIEARRLMAAGLSPEQIAIVFDVEVGPLREKLGRDLALGRIEASAQVGRTLFELATSGDGSVKTFNAAKFYLTHQAGWKEPDRQVVHAGLGGGPINSGETGGHHVITAEIAAEAARILLGIGAGDADEDPGGAEALLP